jgi:hypothetical protein
MTLGGQLRKTPERFLRPDHLRFDNPPGYQHSHTAATAISLRNGNQKPKTEQFTEGS